MDQSGPPTLIHRPYVPLSISTPVHVSSDNKQYTEATQDESSFWEVIPNIPQQLLYPSRGAMGSSPNTTLLPSILLARRVINEIEEHQRTVLDSYAEGMDRETNTSSVLSLDEQQVKTKTNSMEQQPVDIHAELHDNTLQLESPEMEDTGIEQVDPTNVQTQDIEENAKPAEVEISEQQAQVANTDSQVDEEQQEPEISEDQMSRASQDDNY